MYSMSNPNAVNNGIQGIYCLVSTKVLIGKKLNLGLADPALMNKWLLYKPSHTKDSQVDMLRQAFPFTSYRDNWGYYWMLALVFRMYDFNQFNE